MRNKGEEMKYTAFISAKFNKEDSGRLETHKNEIVNFIKNIIGGNPLIIGNLYTGYIRKVLLEEGIELFVVKQHPRILTTLNRKLIKATDIAIFITYKNQSPKIEEFYEYAKKEGKICYKLDIQ